LKKDYTPKEYNDYIEKKSPKSKIFKDTAFAFVIGGFICVIAQIIIGYMASRGASELTIASAVPIIMIGLGAFLTGIGVYEKIAKFAGAGTIIPITGFANAIVSPAMEFKSEGLVLGLGAKMFVIAGPVIVYGTITSVIVGILFFLFK